MVGEEGTVQDCRSRSKLPVAPPALQVIIRVSSHHNVFTGESVARHLPAKIPFILLVGT